MADICRICGATLREFFQSRLPLSVSSACKPVRRPARVVDCEVCGLFQKTADDVVADYLGYEVFHNNPRADKMLFKEGQPWQTRSEFVARLLIEHLGRSHRGRVLEIGCQRGAFLTALRSLAPELELHGCDLDPSYAKIIEPICGPGGYHCGDFADISGPLSACVLIHTLEHVPDPVGMLERVRRLLAPGGLLVIVVPDTVANPLDFYVIDHTCHFEKDVLGRLLQRAGFHGPVSADAIRNELVVVAHPVESEWPGWESSASRGEEILRSLRRREECLRLLPKGPSLVFGTAVIATLIAGILEDDCLGFVDDSPFQVGSTFLGRRICSTNDLRGDRVVLGLAESLALEVAGRLRHQGCDVVNPWLLAKP